MTAFIRWLFALPDPKKERSVVLSVDDEGVILRVAKIRLSRRDLQNALDQFDQLDRLVLRIDSED